MNVMEIYRSVQGEGTLMGVPTTFVRFFACNLRCSWCDTKYLWSLSPKLPSAGENYLRYPVIERFLGTLRPDQQQWKFVIRDDEDEQLLRSLLRMYPIFAEHKLPIILQPEGDTAITDYPVALERLAERVRDPFWW